MREASILTMPTKTSGVLPDPWKDRAHYWQPKARCGTESTLVFLTRRRGSFRTVVFGSPSPRSATPRTSWSDAANTDRLWFEFSVAFFPSWVEAFEEDDMGMHLKWLSLAGAAILLQPTMAVAQPAPFEWPRASAEEARIDLAMPEALKAALAPNTRLQSFGLVRDGKVVIEHYQGATGRETYTNFASVTKSVTAILVGIALDKGVLKSVNQPLTDFFPELNEPDVDAKSRTLTLAHLLSMSSGWQSHYNDTPPVVPTDALKRKIVLNPGETFQYDNASSHLIAIALARAANMPLEQFAIEHLFSPLGIERYIWGRDAQGRTLSVVR